MTTYTKGEPVQFGDEPGVVVEAMPGQRYRVLLENGCEASLPGKLLSPAPPRAKDKAVRGPRD